MVNTPPVGLRLSDEEKLAQQVSNLLEQINHSDPRQAPYPLLASNVRLLLVGRTATGVVEGLAVNTALESVFRSTDSRHRIIPGTPDVRQEGRYGRFTIFIGIQEEGRLVGGCFAFHGDAVLDGKEWFALNLVVTRTRCN